MNFSGNMKNPPDKRRGRDIYWMGLVVSFLIGALIAGLFALAVIKITTKAEAIVQPEQKPPATAPLPDVVTTTPPPVEIPSNEPETLDLGPCRITAYCACEKCCGEWAKNRPDGVVYGAAGIELKAGVSCASPWPIGTVVEIEGLGEYTVQDRPAKWVIEKYGENQFDIYFDDHEAACEFGLQYLNVTVKE